jgi:hypothetical protein
MAGADDMSGGLTRWVRLSILVTAALSVAPGSVVDAAEGGQTSQGTDAGIGTISATAGQDVSGGVSSSGTSTSTPRCTFVPFNLDASGVPGAGTGVARRDAVTKASVDGPPGQNTETLYTRSCPGDPPNYVWAADSVDVDALIRSARQSVSAQLPEPTMNMNPDPSVGGIVNIGLWLAVADPGQVSITASVGPVWATVTARYSSTTWSLGNGDSVVCEGLGTPIVDTSTEDQGPCGYTYRWPSAPKFTGTGDLAYHASVTGHWVVTYATSMGASGTLPAVDRTTEFLYQVREIQTVRVGENG